MNIYNPQTHTALLPELQAALAAVRTQRHFEPRAMALAKAERLNAYLRDCNRNTCVVAVSGGIDSAVVLALVHLASVQPESPIKAIVPVLLPVHDPQAATGQDSATARGKALCHQLGLEPALIDLSAAHRVLAASVEGALGLSGDDWARGQLVAYTRTPALYYVTSVLANVGGRAVVVGTTNKDEGAYLGYFGKASDGLVDVQLISDLFKSEVYAIGAELNVPRAIVEVAPTGDMYDGRLDEEVFGASYDFVELFIASKESFERAPGEWVSPHEVLAPLQGSWPLEAQAQFAMLAERLENLHRYNRHKYLGKSPAVHLDLRCYRLEDGWDTAVWAP